MINWGNLPTFSLLHILVPKLTARVGCVAKMMLTVLTKFFCIIENKVHGHSFGVRFGFYTHFYGSIDKPTIIEVLVGGRTLSRCVNIAPTGTITFIFVQSYLLVLYVRHNICDEIQHLKRT